MHSPANGIVIKYMNIYLLYIILMHLNQVHADATINLEKDMHEDMNVEIGLHNVMRTPCMHVLFVMYYNNNRAL